MNLGQAVAICLYELSRDPDAARPPFPTRESANAESYERITGLLLEMLSDSGYVHEKTSQSTELKIRRLIRRLEIPAGDVETWLGIFRQVLWKVKQG
jgi:tRNA/rRNA methyltransferase